MALECATSILTVQVGVAPTPLFPPRTDEGGQVTPESSADVPTLVGLDAFVDGFFLRLENFEVLLVFVPPGAPTWYFGDFLGLSRRGFHHPRFRILVGPTHKPV